MLLDWGNWGDIDLWETLHLLVREFILSTSKASQETEDGKLFKNDFKSRKEMCKNLKKEVFLSPPVMYWIADHRLHEREIMMRAHQREDLKDKHRNTSEKRGEGFLDICKYNTNITHNVWMCVYCVSTKCVCLRKSQYGLENTSLQRMYKYWHKHIPPHPVCMCVMLQALKGLKLRIRNIHTTQNASVLIPESRKLSWDYF